MSQIVEIIMKVLQWFTIARMRRETGLCGAMHAPDLNDPYFCTRTREHGAQDHSFIPWEKGEAMRWPNIAIKDQPRAIARVTYLLPELTDEARAAVLAVCEAAPKRSLDRATLDEQQRAREGDRLANAAPLNPEHASHVGTDDGPSTEELSDLGRGEMLRAAWLALNDLPADEIAKALAQIRKAPKDPEIANARASAPETWDSNRAGVLGPAMVDALSTIVPAPRPVPGEVADVEHSGERGPRKPHVACWCYADERKPHEKASGSCMFRVGVNS